MVNENVMLWLYDAYDVMFEQITDTNKAHQALGLRLTWGSQVSTLFKFSWLKLVLKSNRVLEILNIIDHPLSGIVST